MRGLRYWLTRLIVLPLPAASRPSKITTIRAFSARTHSWAFTSSAWSRYSSVSYSWRGTRAALAGWFLRGADATWFLWAMRLHPLLPVSQPRPRDGDEGPGGVRPARVAPRAGRPRPSGPGPGPQVAGRPRP